MEDPTPISVAKSQHLLKIIPKNDHHTGGDAAEDKESGFVIWDVEKGDNDEPHQGRSSLLSRVKSAVWRSSPILPEPDLQAVHPNKQRYIKQMCEASSGVLAMNQMSSRRSPLSAIYDRARALAPKRWTQPTVPELITVSDHTERPILTWDGEEFVVYDEYHREAGYFLPTTTTQQYDVEYRGRPQRYVKSFKLEFEGWAAITITHLEAMVVFRSGNISIIRVRQDTGRESFEARRCLLMALEYDLPHLREVKDLD